MGYCVEGVVVLIFCDEGTVPPGNCDAVRHQGGRHVGKRSVSL